MSDAPDTASSASPTLVIEALLKTIASLERMLSTLQRDNKRLVKMVEGLTQQLDRMLGDRAEERKAEFARLQEEAKAMGATAAEPLPAPQGGPDQPPPDPSPPVRPPRKRDKHGRGTPPPELPRDVEPIVPPQCDACGETRLWRLKVLVSEEYDFVRAYLRIRRIERHVCQCAGCKRVITPAQPPMPFDRAACTFAMMAWLLYSRAGLFLPLDRLVRELERMGARIPSATLTRWWGRGADLLLPVAASVRLSLLKDSHIRSDGTGLRVIFPRLLAAPKKGEARPGEVDAEGYLLAKDPVFGQVLVFGNDEHTVYHFTINREGHYLDEFLPLKVTPEGNPILWQGTLTADASSVYDHLYVAGERIESGCNGHGLRKFRDDADKAPLLATQAMHYIGQMFAAEAEARARQLRGAELLAHRQARAGPVAAEFREWLQQHLSDLLPSHSIRKAMQYYLNHWDALTRFLVDPEVDLENNWSERALRKIALFRNASIFVGGEEGARRLCAVLTLVQTARQLGLDPCAYLRWAMERAVPHPNNRGLQPSDLTPAAYKAAQQVQANQV